MLPAARRRKFPRAFARRLPASGPAAAVIEQFDLDVLEDDPASPSSDGVANLAAARALT